MLTPNESGIEGENFDLCRLFFDLFCLFFDLLRFCSHFCLVWIGLTRRDFFHLSSFEIYHSPSCKNKNLPVLFPETMFPPFYMSYSLWQFVGFNVAIDISVLISMSVCLDSAILSLSLSLSHGFKGVLKECYIFGWMLHLCWWTLCFSVVGVMFFCCGTENDFLVMWPKTGPQLKKVTSATENVIFAFMTQLKLWLKLKHW